MPTPTPAPVPGMISLLAAGTNLPPHLVDYLIASNQLSSLELANLAVRPGITTDQLAAIAARDSTVQPVLKLVDVLRMIRAGQPVEQVIRGHYQTFTSHQYEMRTAFRPLLGQHVPEAPEVLKALMGVSPTVLGYVCVTAADTGRWDVVTEGFTAWCDLLNGHEVSVADDGMADYAVSDATLVCVDKDPARLADLLDTATHPAVLASLVSAAAARDSMRDDPRLCSSKFVDVVLLPFLNQELEGHQPSYSRLDVAVSALHRGWSDSTAQVVFDAAEAARRAGATGRRQEVALTVLRELKFRVGAFQGETFPGLAHLSDVPDDQRTPVADWIVRQLPATSPSDWDTLMRIATAMPDRPLAQLITAASAILD